MFRGKPSCLNSTAHTKFANVFTMTIAPNPSQPLHVNATDKFDRCMVFAGGGFRFGAYLGMYAAACDAGKRPDVLLASCGGAIAAAIIHALPNEDARKAWLFSTQLFEYCTRARSTPHAALHRVLFRAAQRRINRKFAAVIPNIFTEYLFEPPNFALPLPAVVPYLNQPAIAIIGAKVLFTPSDVGKARGSQKLFAETIFAHERVLQLLYSARPAVATDPKSAVAPEFCFESPSPLANAVLISTADVVYFPTAAHLGQCYSGGAIDLFPIEIAKLLAKEIIMELKGPLDQNFAQPAWRAIYGIDGNARIRQVQHAFADFWIDTRNIRQKLRTVQVQKRLNWRTGRIALSPPKTHAEFIAQMQAQWRYGYQRGAAAFTNPGVKS